ncbi:HAD family hydrolase [Pseudodesulfovibrio tunisiensis]|uniref:HAD family hydrolase n=1 Tax=Pseudodesulfovibrio tunisiensis TaxID=463192 RepID=UPI001FB1E2FA|nr:ATPase P [Pseudodesulfovibrio tunisiensis]
MITLNIPGQESPLEIDHLVLDFNGTIACDGQIIPGVRELLARCARHLTIHVITADTNGHARTELAGIDCTFTRIPDNDQDQAKLDFVKQLGATSCACIGNGRNDRLMLREAALGMAVLQAEGAFPATLLDADAIFPSILDALNSLRKTNRLIATLRN